MQSRQGRLDAAGPRGALNVKHTLALACVGTVPVFPRGPKAFSVPPSSCLGFLVCILMHAIGSVLSAAQISCRLRVASLSRGFNPNNTETTSKGDEQGTNKPCSSIYRDTHACIHASMNACVYACVYACMYVLCMYGCMYVCKHACIAAYEYRA